MKCSPQSTFDSKLICLYRGNSGLPEMTVTLDDITLNPGVVDATFSATSARYCAMTKKGDEGRSLIRKALFMKTVDQIVAIKGMPKEAKKVLTKLGQSGDLAKVTAPMMRKAIQSLGTPSAVLSIGEAVITQWQKFQRMLNDKSLSEKEIRKRLPKELVGKLEVEDIYVKFRQTTIVGRKAVESLVEQFPILKRLYSFIKGVIGGLERAVKKVHNLVKTILGPKLSALLFTIVLGPVITVLSMRAEIGESAMPFVRAGTDKVLSVLDYALKHPMVTMFLMHFALWIKDSLCLAYYKEQLIAEQKDIEMTLSNLIGLKDVNRAGLDEIRERIKTVSIKTATNEVLRVLTESSPLGGLADTIGKGMRYMDTFSRVAAPIIQAAQTGTKGLGTTTMISALPLLGGLVGGFVYDGVLGVVEKTAGKSARDSLERLGDSVVDGAREVTKLLQEAAKYVVAYIITMGIRDGSTNYMFNESIDVLGELMGACSMERVAKALMVPTKLPSFQKLGSLSMQQGIWLVPDTPEKPIRQGPITYAKLAEANESYVIDAAARLYYLQKVALDFMKNIKSPPKLDDPRALLNWLFAWYVETATIPEILQMIVQEEIQSYPTVFYRDYDDAPKDPDGVIQDYGKEALPYEWMDGWVLRTTVTPKRVTEQLKDLTTFVERVKEMADEQLNEDYWVLRIQLVASGLIFYTVPTYNSTKRYAPLRKNALKRISMFYGESDMPTLRWLGDKEYPKPKIQSLQTTLHRLLQIIKSSILSSDMNDPISKLFNYFYNAKTPSINHHNPHQYVTNKQIDEVVGNNSSLKKDIDFKIYESTKDNFGKSIWRPLTDFKSESIPKAKVKPWQHKLALVRYLALADYEKRRAEDANRAAGRLT
jgi:hypothetical protein